MGAVVGINVGRKVGAAVVGKGVGGVGSCGDFVGLAVGDPVVSHRLAPPSFIAQQLLLEEEKKHTSGTNTLA